MDTLTILLSLAALLFLLIIGTTFYLKLVTQGQTENEPEAPGVQVRRAAGVRGVRQRRGRRVSENQDDVTANSNNEDADDEEQTEESSSLDLAKVGAKKRAKLEAKAERKAQREVEEQNREERKRREQKQQEERDRQYAKEREEEKKREEAEKAAREEKERREYEEYLKMKQAFQVEEEGFEENIDEEREKNLLQEFIDYVKENKIVVLEDLAAHFKLKTTVVIERVQQLQADGLLSGVIDDRGKFIYISEEEMHSVAKFIKQRGRISVTDLVEHSNSLINLNPSQTIGAS